jgi:hypothetical protein
MNCRTIHHWLLTSPSGEALPKPLRRHLRDCARCRRRMRRLVRTEEELKSVVAPSSEAGLQRFLKRLDALPPQEAGPAALPRPRLILRRSIVYWAASILFALGVSGMIYFTREPEPELPRPRVNPDHARTARAEDQLVARFVERDLVLAGTVVPAKQWQVLSEMADDLRTEAIRLADEKKPDDLPMVTSLYERVLQRGLVGRAGSLPEKERKELLQKLAQHLRNHDRALEDRLQQSPQNWLTLLQPMQKANRQSLDVLAADKVLARPQVEVPPSIPGGSDYRRLLLSALVMNGIRLAEETDPLKRADCCSDLADHLLQAIVTASVKGDDHNVSALGKNLGEFVDRGISVNLARVSVNDPRVAELKDLMQRTTHIMLALDRTLEQMSAKGASNKLDPASLDRLKDLEKMLKDVEKSLKKVHHAFKDGEKKKEKEKDQKGKSKGKAKDVSQAIPFPSDAYRWIVARRFEKVATRREDLLG